MIRICSVLLALLLASPGNAGALERIRENGVLRVAVYKDFPPYSYLEKGRMRGLDVEIARALAERLGVGLSTMNLTASDEAMEDDLRNAIWKGHYLGGGTADVMMHVPVDARFAAENDKVLIFAPYFREEILIAHDRERIPELNDLLVFTTERIGVELETFPDMLLSRVENGRLIDKIVHYRYVEQACRGLLSGETAAFVAPRAQLEDCIGGQDERFALTPLPVRARLLSWTVGMAVKEDAGDLREALVSTLDQIRNDGTLERIFAEYGITYLPPADR